MKENRKFIIGPNEASDGCINHNNGIQMLCSSCPAKNISTMATNEKVCEILKYGNRSYIKSLRKSVNSRVQKMIALRLIEN